MRAAGPAGAAFQTVLIINDHMVALVAPGVGARGADRGARARAALLADLRITDLQMRLPVIARFVGVEFVFLRNRLGRVSFFMAILHEAVTPF